MPDADLAIAFALPGGLPSALTLTPVTALGPATVLPDILTVRHIPFPLSTLRI